MTSHMCCINDRKAFARAVEQFTAHPGDINSIATMMRLSFEAEQDALRHWARAWLAKFANVKVIVEREVGEEHATPSKAAGFC